MTIPLLLMILLSVPELHFCLRSPIRDVVPQLDSKWCYHCEGDCSGLAAVKCGSGSSKCFSLATAAGGGGTRVTKGCVEAESAGAVCDSGSSAEVTSCYTCEGHFCNHSERQADARGAGKCYVCIDECANPPDQHVCDEVLPEAGGKTACLSYEVRDGAEVTVSKGCIADDDVIRSTCALANILFEGVTCSICDTDLCNHATEVVGEGEPGVDECYHCEDVCEGPIATHNCSHVLDEGAISRCLLLNATYLDQQFLYKGCVDYTDDVHNFCNLAKELGGTCEICNTNLCNGISNEEEGGGEEEEEKEDEEEEEEKDDNNSNAERITALMCNLLVVIFTFSLV